ncbi:MAG: hypothetical protein WKG07_19060 [Hymenobacter sp.]
MPTLTSATARVEIAPHGAELTSFSSLATGLEYMWQADPAQWGRHAPLLFPIVGKLPDDTYLLDGEAYKLPQHGFARDQEFQLIGQDAHSLTFQLMAGEASKKPTPSNLSCACATSCVAMCSAWAGTCATRPPRRRRCCSASERTRHFGARWAEMSEFEDYAFHFDHPVTLQRQLLRGGLRTGETAYPRSLAQDSYPSRMSCLPTTRWCSATSTSPA